jgi:hypothetical protein
MDKKELQIDCVYEANMQVSVDKKGLQANWLF